jgi:hypothetical protein
MPIDGNLLHRLAEHTYLKQCTMKIGNDVFSVDSADLSYSPVPVRKPTTRGGVFFSDKMAFKIRAMVSDLSIKNVLSKTMLGPNQDFEKIQLSTSVEDDSKKKELIISTNLTNYVQKKSGLELNLVVVETELSN